VLGEVYSYAIEPDGFYFIDHLADRTVAAVALQSLLDEALRFNDTVELTSFSPSTSPAVAQTAMSRRLSRPETGTQC
jgi:hypothetical protein